MAAKARGGSVRYFGVRSVITIGLLLAGRPLTAGEPARDEGQHRETCTAFTHGECINEFDWCEPIPGTCTTGQPDGLCTAVAGGRFEGESCDGQTWETRCGEDLSCLVGECRLLCHQWATLGELGDTCQLGDPCVALRGDECIGFCASLDLVFVDDFEIGDTGGWSSSGPL